MLFWAAINNDLEVINEITRICHASLEQKSDKSLGSSMANILSTALTQCPSDIEILSMHLSISKVFWKGNVSKSYYFPGS